MRRVGIGRPNKRLRPTENARSEAFNSPLESDPPPGPEPDILECGGTATQSQGRNVLHSTAIGTPTKRVALFDPLDSDDDEILPPSPTPASRSIHVLSQVQNTSQRFNPNPNYRPTQGTQRPQAPASKSPEPEPAPSQHVLHSQRRGREIPIVINGPSGYPDFSNVLQECGYLLSTPPARNYIQRSELLFRKELNDWIEERLKEEPQGIMNTGMKFISAMRTYLSTYVHLRHSMTPTQHPDFVPQRSLLHNLLCIPAIQPYILEIIFPALAEACYSAGENQETVDTLVGIVQQLRWLPKIVDADKFVSTILDFVKSGTAVAQKQLIVSLPEIIPEDRHQKIADALRILLERPQEREVVPAIMDCFSSLDVPSKEWMKVHEAALSQMFDSPLSHYPAFFAFLFRTEDAMILSETISSMREKLEITPLGEREVKNPVYMVEIVEKIRFCAAVNSHLTHIWVKLLKTDIENQDVRPIDLIMLLIFAEYSKPPVAALNLIFSNKDMAIQLFDNLLKNNLPILNQVFKTLLNICCLALRNKEKDTHAVMEHILTNLFLRLSLIEAQEIAFRLSNFLVESNTSREASLRILTALATKNPERLLHFSAHLMSVLASVMSYPYGQIKQLMNVLAMLANVDRNKSSEGFASELAIFLRKQLTHFSDSTRCFGVLGTLVTVKQLCQKETTGEKIKEFLNLVWSLVEREEDACLLFLDELSEITEVIPESICKKFQLIMIQKFQEYWTTSEDGATRKTNDEVGIRLSESFDANRELEEKEQLFISFQEKPLAMSPLVAPSHLRLVARLVSARENGDLTLIDAILGCPVILPDMESYYSDVKKLTDCTYDQKKKLGRYLVLAINFFRESISAFVKQSDPELRIKIWLRLTNIAYLQQLLVKNFHHFPCLPKAYIEEICVTNRFGASVGAAKQKREEKDTSISKKKATKPAKDLNKSKNSKKDLDKSIANRTKKSNKAGENSELENLIQPKFITPYLRRFDIQVFPGILRSPLNDGPPIDFTLVAQNISSSPSQQLAEVAKFTPDTLTMLLVEIHQQTKDSNFDVLSVKNIITAICLHLDNIESLYERKKVPKEDEARFETCFRLLLHTFRLILESIQSRAKRDRQELLLKVIEKVAKRISNPSSESEEDFSIKLRSTAAYFANFSKCVKFPSTAVEHLLLLKHLDDLAKGDKDTVPYIENVSREYLTKDWDLLPVQVDTILKTWLRKAEHPLNVVQEITRALIPNDGNDFDNDIPCNETYKSCSSTNFHVWYSTLISSLASHVHKCGKFPAAEELFEFWNKAVLVLKDLVLVIQQLRDNRFLLPLLKHTRQFFEALNTHCVKRLPAIIRLDSVDTKKFIKSLQHVTRKVQVVCAHSKVEKDTNLLRFVPLLRKALESLVFRVRESLAGSGLTNAFILGALKHKNIDGEVLNSQPYDSDEVSDEDSEMNDDNDDGNTSDLLPTNAAQLPFAGAQEEEMDVDENEDGESSSADPEQQDYNAEDDEDMFEDDGAVD